MANKEEMLCGVKIDGKDFVIPLKMDNDSVVNFSSVFNIYNDYNKNIVDTASKIRAEKMFDEETVDKAFAHYTQFVPFKHQVENVKTMLYIFEGRGCFGDQVGLGKTVEALMTAHAMYECGAIKNVVIVATSQTAEQWKDEIEKKFIVNLDGKYVDGKYVKVFEVRNEYRDNDKKKLETHVDKVSSKLLDDKADKNIKFSGCPVYIMSAESITGSALERANKLEKCLAHLTYQDEYETECFKKVLKMSYENFAERLNGPYEFLLLNGFIHPVVTKESCDNIIEKYSLKYDGEEVFTDGGFEYYDNVVKQCKMGGASNKLAFYKKQDGNICFPSIKKCEVLLDFLLGKLEGLWHAHRNQSFEYSEDFKAIKPKLLDGRSFCGACAEAFNLNIEAEDPTIENVFVTMFIKDIKNSAAVINESFPKFLSFCRAIEEVCNKLLFLSRFAKEIKEERENAKDRTQLGTLDLLIIDEVHNFATDDKNSKKTSALVQFAHDIESKFCVLMSATPIRKGLSDAADIASIAKKDRYGNTPSKQKRHFYSVICGVGSDEHALGIMAANGQVNRVNGVINSAFTRSRVGDGNVNMIKKFDPKEKDIEERAAKKRSSQIVEYIEDLSKRAKTSVIAANLLEHIKAQYYINRAIKIKQGGDAVDLTHNAITTWELFLGKIEKNAAEDGGYLMFCNAFDMGVMDFLSKNEIHLPAKDELLSAANIHTLVDWARPFKSLVIRKTSLSEADKQKSVIDDVVDILSGKIEGGDKHILACGRVVVYAASANEQDELQDKLAGIKREKRFAGEAGYFTEFVHDGRDRITDSSETAADYSLRESISNNFNEIYIANGRTGRGTNLMAADTLILMQMDVWDGSSHIAEPLDIEQWIGRIYRTGQKRNCTVIVYPRVVSQRAKEKGWDNKDLLDFYIRVLKDNAGLDLFGKGNAEVGYIAPIVVDYLHMVCDRCCEDKQNKYKDKNDMILEEATYSGAVLETPKFSDFVKLVYNGTLKLKIVSESGVKTGEEALLSVIRKICRSVSDSTEAKSATGDKNE